MVIEEILNEKFVRHYSDDGMKLRQVETGILYDEAVDLIPSQYTYLQTDIRIETEENTGGD